MLDILFWVSVFSGGMMFLLLILSLIGGLDFDLDLDVGGDADMDGGGGLGIFKGLLTFISMGAWVMRILLISQQSTTISLLGGIVVGLVTVYLLSKLLSYLISQQEFNSWEMSDLIGASGKVYLKIPHGGQGMVHVIHNDSVKELKAISREESDIATGGSVEIIDVEEGRLVVTPLD
ncbi:hypothetical protein N9B82_02400 [Saprospiraceae bacterium]|nr:hypothetical protein [Saprospiraceae bacterium]